MPAPTSRRAELGKEQLGYTARAGLLPELSRQTYDTVDKAIREAVLNALDAGATRIEIDFAELPVDGSLVISDNGAGMSAAAVHSDFMSLGGSRRFSEADNFGRIGIGSLALLQYARRSTVETKQAGSTAYALAEVEHPWELDTQSRRSKLSDVDAGEVFRYAYQGSRADHFTRITLHECDEQLAAQAADPMSFYKLIERLRRTLPLRWQASGVLAALESQSPSTAALIAQHADRYSAAIVVQSPWDTGVELARLTFGGDDPDERWLGPPTVVDKHLRADNEREIQIVGYLLSQAKAHPRWSGLTARVQNVAVEEGTFFELESDPGFRRYITGEIWILGDVDKARLININRSSFNREAPDYQLIRSYISREITNFKVRRVQRPQRLRTTVRKLLDRRVAALNAVAGVLASAYDLSKTRRLPVSGPGIRLAGPAVDLCGELESEGVAVKTRDDGGLSYEIATSSNGTDLVVAPTKDLANGKLRDLTQTHTVIFRRAGPHMPPVALRTGGQVVLNIGHELHSENNPQSFALSLAVELAYLMGDARDAAGLQQRLLQLLGDRTD